jgi:hypothetical protein
MKLLAVVVCMIALEGCAMKPRVAGVRPQLSHTAANDSIAFSAVLGLLYKEGFDGKRYRIDARPLPPDPSLISPGLRVERNMDSASAVAAVFGAMDSAVVQARRRILRRRGIAESDVIRDSGCPGVLTPYTKEKMAVLERTCPAEHSYSIAIALPRRGGPGMQPVADASGVEVTIRVIAISLSPRGASHGSADYVFLEEPSGLRFVKRVEIAFIE